MKGGRRYAVQHRQASVRVSKCPYLALAAYKRRAEGEMERRCAARRS